MSEREEQRKRFEEALERKAEEQARGDEHSREREPAPGPGPISGGERSLVEADRPQDVLSPREKSSGHGKKTADEWNQ